MEAPKVVIDTNVLVSALRSRRGASFRLLEMLGGERFEIQVSVPLVLEYESVANRVAPSVGLSSEDVGDVIDYVCSVANRRKIFFLWRPFLRDPKDDHVLELAVESQCDFIVTYNTRDFKGADQFGLHVVTPREFLDILGEIR
ncbi:MAG TPA: putative toxin-antitoxin system toxin component, PIN family [Thermoguttaceae bacterium]|nr:putative toxin-antitoxin system toxin component, PIN family [Thermoguttaceae bacterium]